MMKLSVEYKNIKTRKIIEIVNYKTTLSWSISSYKTHIKVQVKYPQILEFLAERLRLSNKPFSDPFFFKPSNSLQNKRRGILNYRQ